LLERNQANFFAYNAALVIPGKGEIYDTPDLKWVYTGTVSNNRIFSNTVKPEQIARAAKFFAQKEVPVVWVFGNTDPGLEKPLEDNAFQYFDRWVAMSLKLSKLLPPSMLPRGSSIEPVTLQTLPAWAEVIGKASQLAKTRVKILMQLFEHALENPAMQHFLVRLHGEPVAALSLFEAAGAIGVYHVATVPGARGKGLATTYLGQRLAPNSSKMAVLQASKMGLGVYKHLGFVENGYFDTYFRHARP